MDAVGRSLSACTAEDERVVLAVVLQFIIPKHLELYTRRPTPSLAPCGGMSPPFREEPKEAVNAEASVPSAHTDLLGPAGGLELECKDSSRLGHDYSFHQLAARECAA